MELETRRIGGTSVAVTVLGLGGATLGGNIVHHSNSDARLLVLDAYFDTAPYYGYGRSEHLVGDELRPPGRLGPFGPRWGADWTAAEAASRQRSLDPSFPVRAAVRL